MDWAFTGSIAGISNIMTRNHIMNRIHANDQLHVLDRNQGRARRSLAATCFILSLGLLVFAGCDSESLFSGSSTSTDRALQVLEPSAMVIAHVDVQKGFETLEEFGFQDEADRDEMDAAMTKIAEIMGINPREDVHDLFVSVSVTDQNPKLNMVAFLDFDQELMTARLNETSELTRTESAGKTDRYTLQDEDQVQFVLVDGKMIFVSSETESLDNMLARSGQADGSAFTSDKLFDSVKDLEHWVVVRNLDTLIGEMGEIEVQGELGSAIPALKAIQAVALGLNTSGNDIEGALFLEPNSTVDAKDLASVLSGLRAAARLQLENDEDLMEKLEEIDISTKNGLVRISMESERSELLDLFQDLGSRMKDAAGKVTRSSSSI